MTMQSGIYEISVDVDGRAGSGLASLDHGTMTGRDAWYEFDGKYLDAEDKFIASLILHTCKDADLTTLPCAMDAYPLSLSGVCTSGTFHAVGKGPNGIVMEMNGTRIGAEVVQSAETIEK